MRRPAWVIVIAVAVAVFLLASLVLMSDATQNPGFFGQLFVALFCVNVLGITTIVVLIAADIRQLVRQLRARAPGARLTLRMVLIFTALAAVPVVIVYGFSLDFLRRGIESWFTVRTDQAMRDALELSRTALDLRMRELLRQTEQIAEDLNEAALPPTPLRLDDLRDVTSTVVSNTADFAGVDLDAYRRRTGADEMALLTRKGSIITFSSGASELVPTIPNQAVLLQVQQGQNYIGLDPIRDAGLYARVVVNVPNIGLSSDARILQALYPVAPRMNELAENVQAVFAKYDELAYLRDKLRVSFVMTLTLVLLFSVASAVWAAFYSARRLAAPIRDLAEGTRAVATGNYELRLPAASQDDMGFLVASFNDMTSRIAQARDEARRHRDQVDAERAYLEAVLGRLSSGVLTLDSECRLRTVNDAASQILGVPLAGLLGSPLSALCEPHPYLQPFCDRIAAHLAGPAADWQEQAVLFGTSGRQVLICRGTALPSAGAHLAGHVIVFDDITALIQAQRNAAWSEVARRVAHEIKNPLTPIQLSAERLRHKYLHTMQPQDAEVLDRLTNTIVQQVESLKQMVNTFSEYARTPKMQPEHVNVNRIIEEVIELYRSVDRNATIEARLDLEMPATEADSGRLRQVLNNLVKNALEAARPDEPPYVLVTTRCTQDTNTSYIEIRVEDRGVGVAQEMLGSVFEPYVTTKTKGTGLGLAIVKKIVEEHGGLVWMENNAGGGAAVVIRLPTAIPVQSITDTRPERRDAV